MAILAVMLAISMASTAEMGAILMTVMVMFAMITVKTAATIE